MFYLDVAAYLLVVSIILDDIDGHYSSQSSRHLPTLGFGWIFFKF